MTADLKAGDLKDRVAEACCVLGVLDLAKGATGHASCRVPGQDRAYVRARGPGELGVRYTTRSQIVEVDFDGKMVGEPEEEGLETPIEVFIHTAVYKARPDVNAVVHVHPTAVVLFTIVGKPLLPLYGAYDPASLALALEGIPTYERSILISNAQLGADLAKALGGKTTCMMRGHGITATGNTVEEAALAAISLNELASVNYQARLLGDPMPISKEDQEAFKARPRKKSAGTAEDKPEARAAALWRYYVELTKAQ